MDDERIRLILEMTGADSIQDAIKALDELGRKVGAAPEQINAMGVALRMVQAELDGDAEALRRLKAEAEGSADVAAVLDQLGYSAAESGVNFKDLSRGFMDLERAGTALATGTGLARAGPMLERIVGLIGGPAGLGLAIGGLAFAIEGVLPKLAKFFDLWDEEKLKRVEASLKELEAAAKRVEGLRPPSEAELGKEVEGFVAAYGGQRVGAGIRESLRETARQLLTPEEQQFLTYIKGAKERGEEIEPAQLVREERLQDKAMEAAERRAQELLREMVTPGGIRAREEVAGMAARRPGFFGTTRQAGLEFAEGLRGFTPEARARDKAEAEAIDAEEAERIGRKERRRQEAQEDAAREKEYEKAARETEHANREQDRIEAAEAQARRRTQAADVHEVLARGREALAHGREVIQEAKRTAREADPSNQLRRQQEAVRDEVSAEVLNRWQEAGRPMNEDLPAITRQAIEDLPQTGGNVAAAVQWAIQQVHQKMVLDDMRAADQIMRYAGRMDSVSPYAPSFMPRSQ